MDRKTQEMFFLDLDLRSALYCTTGRYYKPYEDARPEFRKKVSEEDKAVQSKKVAWVGNRFSSAS